MRMKIVAAAACALATAAMAGPFDQFKGKMKPGLYEMKMDMEMPGMPAGMGKQSMTMQNCVTDKDIEGGELGGKNNRTSCEVKDMKMSGDTATYKMVCKEPPMTSDSKITWRGDGGYVMDVKSTMSHGGQTMNMTSHMEGRYLGPCKK